MSTHRYDGVFGRFDIVEAPGLPPNVALMFNPSRESTASRQDTLTPEMIIEALRKLPRKPELRLSKHCVDAEGKPAVYKLQLPDQPEVIFAHPDVGLHHRW